MSETNTNDTATNLAFNSVGTTLSIGTGSSKKAIGQLTEIGEISSDMETIDVTTLGSTGGYREYLGGFKTPGTVDVSGFLAKQGGDAGQLALMSAYGSGTPEAFEVAFPDESTVTFNAIVKQKAFGPANIGSAVNFRAQLQITGAITYTPGT